MCTKPPPSLASAGVAVSEEVEKLVARLLSKSAEGRFATMREAIEAGDRAFAAPAVAPSPRAQARLAPRPSPVLGRYVGLHVALVVGGLGGLWAVGYAGRERHDPLAWLHIGGAGQWLTGALFIAAVAGFAVAAHRRAQTGRPSLFGFWLALLPALTGAFGTYAGWHAILAHMPRIEPGSSGSCDFRVACRRPTPTESPWASGCRRSCACRSRR